MNTRYRCPSCQQRDKTFSLYIDTETGEHLHPSVGRCNRESNCGHHYTPKQYFQDNNFSFDTPQPKAYKPRPVTPQPKPVSFIPVEVFKQSLQIEKSVSQVAETNHFVKFLINLFGVEVANNLRKRYFIGTSKHWNGATVFWQIDTQGKIRTGKIMLYSPTTGKRVKEPFNHIHWEHKALKQPEFELRQCLFGEHLLIDKTKPVAIVESEKTAVIASGYLPQFIWVAVGSLTNLNAEKCSILKGRPIKARSKAHSIWEMEQQSKGTFTPCSVYRFRFTGTQSHRSRKKTRAWPCRLFNKIRLQSLYTTWTRSHRATPSRSNIGWGETIWAARTCLLFQQARTTEARKLEQWYCRTWKLLCKYWTTNPTRKAEPMQHNNKLFPIYWKPLCHRESEQRETNLFTIPEQIAGTQTSINHKFKLIWIQRQKSRF